MYIPDDSLSDTVIPHIRPFLGMPGRHLSAGFRQRQAIGVSCSLSFLVRALQPGWRAVTVTVLAVCVVRAFSAAVAGSQVRVISCSRRYPITSPGLTSALTSAPARVRRRARVAGRGEQQVQGGQVRRQLVLADVGVLRPGRVRRHRAGVAVPAAVCRPAAGPGRLHPATAQPAGEQPGEQVPADHGPGLRGRAAGRVDGLGGDEIGFADQRRMRGPAGDDPAAGQVPPLHALVPEGHIGGVGQLGVGPLPVPHLPPRVPGVLQDRGHRADRPARPCPVGVPAGVGGRRARHPGLIQGTGDPRGRVAGQALGEDPPHDRRRPRVRVQAVRAPAPRGVRLFGCGPASASWYPYGGRPPR